MKSKEALRRSIRAERAAESAGAASARAAALAQAAGELAPLAEVGVAAFLPTNAEPDIGSLLRALAVPVYLPRTAGTDLEWVRGVAGDVQGVRRGIPRPAGAAVARGGGLFTDIGVRLVLVPAVAVDPDDGTRLGYGAGYYDRLLAALRATPAGGPEPVAVGVCRGADLIALPREDHDQPLDGVLTEGGLAWFRRPVQPRAAPPRSG